MAKIHAVYDSDSRSDTSAGGDSDNDEDSNPEDGDNNPEDGDNNPKNGDKKSGLANVMTNILHKPVAKHKQTILSKGKTDKQIRKRKAEVKHSDDSDDDDEDDSDGSQDKKKKEIDHSEKISRIEKKKVWEEMGRVRPSLEERDKERQLQRIAQRGVVQLFNAVRKQQKLVEEKITEAGTSERKKYQVMGTMTKGKFLDILKGTQIHNGGDSEEESKESGKQIDSKSGNKRWDILREDFMMGAKMKDWDKDSSDEGISMSAKDQKTEISDSDSE